MDMDNVTATQKQVCPAGNGWANGFHEPQGSASSLKEEALMFDNEIDWVTQLELRLKHREADKWQ